jgi:hypothetical protein
MLGEENMMIRDLTLTGYIVQTIVCVKNMYFVIRLVLYRGGYCHLSYELHRNTIVICQTVQS